MILTGAETIGVSDTVVPGCLSDLVKNTTWIVSASGWSEAQVASLKARQASFRDEWTVPGMDVYND